MALRRIPAGMLKAATLAGATLAGAWFGGVVLGIYSLRNVDSAALEADLSASPLMVPSVMRLDASGSAGTDQATGGQDGSANLSVADGAAESASAHAEYPGTRPAEVPAPSGMPDDQSDFYAQSEPLTGSEKGARLSSRLSWSRARFKAVPKHGFHVVRLCMIPAPCGIEQQEQVVMRRKGGDEHGNAPLVIGVGF
jgi:hypothetical protein